MSRYSITERLPSCRVSHRIIEELEVYMRKSAEDLKGDDDCKINFEVTIIDSIGTETLQAIKDFDRSKFPDDTRVIYIETKCYGNTNLNIEVKFASAKSLSELNVRYDGKSAREVVTGLSNELLHRIGAYKTNHHFFHIGILHIIMMAVVLLPLPTVISTWSNLLPDAKSKVLYLSITVFFVATLYLSLVLLKPYTSFDSRRNEVNEHRANWIVGGIAAFFLFTVVGVYLRQKLLGF